jgi:hypothetical protein
MAQTTQQQDTTATLLFALIGTDNKMRAATAGVSGQAAGFSSAQIVAGIVTLYLKTAATPANLEIIATNFKAGWNSDKAKANATITRLNQLIASVGT